MKIITINGHMALVHEHRTHVFDSVSVDNHTASLHFGPMLTHQVYQTEFNQFCELYEQHFH